MTSYRIFRLDPEHAKRFREASPAASRRQLKPTRYVEAGTVEADSPYEAWKLLQSQEEAALGVGDVLQEGNDSPLLCTYWGFEPGSWDTPEQKGPDAPTEIETKEGLYASSM